ncbi:MAG: hypothetical protein ACYDD1_17950, partial [Caulobacteraceae bacterium]
MLTSYTPTGSFLTAKSSVKLRMVELLAPDGQRVSFFGYGGAINAGSLTYASPLQIAPTYPFSKADVLAQLTYFKSLGFNCIKLGNPFLTGQWDAPGLYANVMWTIAQIRAMGMRVYVKITGSNNWTVSILNYISVVSWWAQNARDILVGIDLNNEVNNGSNPGWTSDTKSIPSGSTTVADMTA